ncbi:tRNA pseudouridine(38-40) synthase TruA [Thermogutta terrifontis]|uniref:tRNA pseudouridine(38-40) synthase TruA n=1 Tax=Thermogutta terrifontis TaxID=1331910 RepID=UPI001A9A43E0|nr:tRNA pseudouridine(38-40) synthase TruA [Thermogutta terrifontis]
MVHQDSTVQGADDAVRCIRLTLAYDGSHYLGWQKQPQGKTIQGVLEEALQQLTGAPTRVLASGRTDVGVHALGQVAAFRTKSRLGCPVIQRALNALLPSDIVVLSVEEVPLSFHPIRDARRKRYRYLIWDSPLKPVFLRQYVWFLGKPLDVQAMVAAAAYLLGEHDFSAFETGGAKRKTSVRTVYELTVTRRHPGLPNLITVEIEANGFLYNMVRNIVGSLVEVGRGAYAPAWMQQVLLRKDRRLAGPTAPGSGLFLVGVSYSDTPVASSPDPWDLFTTRGHSSASCD